MRASLLSMPLALPLFDDPPSPPVVCYFRGATGPSSRSSPAASPTSIGCARHNTNARTDEELLKVWLKSQRPRSRRHCARGWVGPIPCRAFRGFGPRCGRHGPRGNGLAVTSGPQLPEQSTPTDPEHAGHIVSIEFTLAQHLTGSGDLGRSHFSAPATDPAFCFGRRQASSGSLQHEVALKQRDGAQYIEHQLAGAPVGRKNRASSSSCGLLINVM
jgi:hypothetical protein